MTDISKYKNVSLPKETYNKIDLLRQVIVPQMKISRSQTITLLVNEKAKKLTNTACILSFIVPHQTLLNHIRSLHPHVQELCRTPSGFGRYPFRSQLTLVTQREAFVQTPTHRSNSLYSTSTAQQQLLIVVCYLQIQPNKSPVPSFIT